MTHNTLLLILTASISIASSTEVSCQIDTSISCTIDAGPLAGQPCDFLYDERNNGMECRDYSVEFKYDICKTDHITDRLLIFTPQKTWAKLRGKKIHQFTDKSPIERSDRCRSITQSTMINSCDGIPKAGLKVRGEISKGEKCSGRSVLKIEQRPRDGGHRTPDETCPCFTTEDLSKAVTSIREEEGRYLHVYQNSCQESDGSALSLSGNPYNSSGGGYRVYGSKCRESDMVRRINFGQASHCLDLLRSTCESISDILNNPKETCPCFGVRDLASAVNENVFSANRVDLCEKSDSGIVMTPPSTGEEDLRYAVDIEHPTCMGENGDANIDSEEASQCYTLLEDACNSVTVSMTS